MNVYGGIMAFQDSRQTGDNALFPNRSRTPYACGCCAW